MTHRIDCLRKPEQLICAHKTRLIFHFLLQCLYQAVMYFFVLEVSSLPFLPIFYLIYNFSNCVVFIFVTHILTFIFNVDSRITQLNKISFFKRELNNSKSSSDNLHNKKTHHNLIWSLTVSGGIENVSLQIIWRERVCTNVILDIWLHH